MRHVELLELSDVLVADGKARLATAVAICVQDKLHAQLTIEFARRGFHILCEKPLGVTAQECIRVTEEVEKSGVLFVLGHSECDKAARHLINTRYRPPLLSICHVPHRADTL